MDSGTASTASNFYISEYYRHLVRCGLNADEVLFQAGIDPGIVDQPDRRVGADGLARVIQRLTLELQDEAMALADKVLPRGSFYLVGKLAVQEPNLARALSTAGHFMTMIDGAYRLEIDADEREACLKIHLMAPEKDPSHLLAEILLMAYHRFSSWLIAESITLNEVAFNYPPPIQVGEYSYLFPAAHRFNAPYLGFTFPRRFLDCEPRRQRAALKRYIQGCPREFFFRPRTDFSLSSELEQLLGKHIGKGLPTVDEAAAMLHTTRRTMIRRLNDEGTSYQRIKDLVRRDRAIGLLVRHSYSVVEVAEKLGFSDSSVFARAFKGWTGSTPSDFREQFDPGQG